MKTVVIILVLCVFLIVLFSFFATYNYVMDKVSDAVYKVVEKETISKFKKAKRPIYNKDKSYTATVTKTIQSRVNEVSRQFYSEDFYFYYKSHRPILKCHTDRLIKGYLRREVKMDNNFNYMTPEHFFKLRKKYNGDIVGCYVIYNKTKRKYYVGQATRLFFRVNQHFTGHGCGDVYADYKRGRDKFTIRLIPLVNSGYYDLDKMEKDLIAKYNAYDRGYNKTIGNGV